jgi:hypothetical protein
LKLRRPSALHVEAAFVGFLMAAALIVSVAGLIRNIF